MDLQPLFIPFVLTVMGSFAVVLGGDGSILRAANQRENRSASSASDRPACAAMLPPSLNAKARIDART